MEPNTGKYVFLDIDGVLNNTYPQDLKQNPTKYKVMRGADIIHVSKLEALKRFCSRFDAKVVIVSSWATPYSIARLRAFLEVNVIGAVDDTGGGKGRGRSVLNYIHQHDIKYAVILDDSRTQCYDFDIPSVPIDGIDEIFLRGLLFEDYRAILKWLDKYYYKENRHFCKIYSVLNVEVILQFWFSRKTIILFLVLDKTDN